MVLSKLPRILFIYLLVYFKSVHSNIQIEKPITLPSYEELYPKSLVFSIKGNTAYNFKNSMRIYRFEDNKWKSVFSGILDPKSLNVQSRGSCADYYCLRTDGVYTYTPKRDKLFNMVNRDITGGSYGLIWALTGATDYANKVVYDESDPKCLIVTTYHINGLKRTFTKQPYCKWEEHVSKASDTELIADKVEILIQSESGMPGVLIEKDDDHLKYTFEDWTRCLSVEYDREQLLKTYNINPNTLYPKSVMFCISSKTTVVAYADSMDILRLYNNRWLSVYSGKGEGKSLDVQSKGSCDDYKCIKKQNVYTYTPKGDCLFNKVRSQLGNELDEILFETTDILEMATVVKYDETDPNKLVLKILQLNGKKRTFRRSLFGQWELSVSKDSSFEVSTDKGGMGPITHSPLKTSELYLDLSKITILVEDASDPSKRIECNSSMYAIEVTKGIMITYNLKDGVKCVEVRYDNKVAWNYNPSKPDEYPKFLHFLLTGPVVVEMSKDLFYFSFRRSNSDWESVTMGKFDFKTDDVNLMTTDDKLEPVVLNPERFKSIVHGFFMEYRFPSGTKCEALKLNTHYPWTFDDSVYGQYPSSVYVFANEILALCGDKAFVKRFDPTRPGESFQSREIMKPALAGFKFVKKDGYLFYEIDSRVKCVGVNYDDKAVWQRDPTMIYAPYPKSVMFCIKSNTAIIHFGYSGDIIRFNEGEWKPIISGHPQPVYLYIKDKHNTEFFEYEKTGKVHTYTAQGLYVFSALIKSRMFFASDEIVWKTANLVDCASKVVYDETDSNHKVVTIHHLNGLIRTLKKEYGCWQESSVKDSGSELTADKVKILTENDPSAPETNQVVEPTTGETRVNGAQPSERDEQPGSSLSPETITDSQEPDDDVSEDETESVGDVQAIVEESKIPSTSPQSDASTNLVHLDIRTRMSTNQFFYSQTYGFWIYTARDGYYFSSVRDGNFLIYKRSTSGSPVKVIAEVDASSTLIGLTLHLVNKEIKRFKYSNRIVEEKVYRTTTGHHSGSETIPDVPSPDYYSLSQDRSPSLRAQECAS